MTSIPQIVQELQQHIEAIQRRHCIECPIGKLVLKLTEVKQELATIEVRPEPALIVEPPLKSARKANKEMAGKKSRDGLVKGTRVCNKCAAIKPLEEFPRNKGCSEGRTGTCKACTQERHRISYKSRAARKPGKSTAAECETRFLPEMDFEPFSMPAEKVELLFQCIPCHAKFISRPALEEHNALKHNGAPPTYKCDECDRTFPTEEALLDHVEVRHS